MVELRPEPPLDLRADLGAEPEEEPTAAEQLVIVGLMRQVYRVARKRDGHIRHQVQAAYGGGQRQRGEHVMPALEGGHTAGAGVAQSPRALGGVDRPVQRGEDLHVPA